MYTFINSIKKNALSQPLHIVVTVITFSQLLILNRQIAIIFNKTKKNWGAKKSVNVFITVLCLKLN